MRTYLIESQLLFIPYLVHVLERAGCEVVATSQVVDCADIVAKAPAAILVDVDYFEQSGPTLLCRIRAAVEHAKLIVLSEVDERLFKATCIVAGASTVCSKSEGEEKLLRTIRNALVKTGP